MAHIDSKELYPIYYALHLHQSGRQEIPSLTLSDELMTSLGRFRKKNGNTVPPPPSPLTQDKVKAAVKHAKHCTECQILLFEDGPEVPRPKTAEELAEEERLAAEEEEALVRKFFVSAGYALLAFCAGWFCFYRYAMLEAEKQREVVESVISSTNPDGMTMHPLQMIGFGLFFVCAWGIATCWTIARHQFLDFGRVQEAVPVVGKAWHARSKRKKREREKAEKRTQKSK